MRAIQQHITKRQTEFRHHPFLEKLQQENDFQKGMEFISKIAFWALVFQDFLRILPTQIETKELRRIATHHKIEDANHDDWFLDDLAKLHKDHSYNIRWLFSKENEKVRDVSYRIMTELFTCTSDIQRVTLILALEPTGHVFFENIAHYVERHGYSNQLKYFSSYHIEVEKSHAIFEDALNEALFSCEISDVDRQTIIDMVDRIFDYFTTFFNEFLPYFENTSPLAA